MAEFPLTVTTVSGKGSALNAVEFDSNLIKTRDCVNDLNERKADKSDLTSHTTDTNNPHNVTAAQLGAANILEQIKTVDGTGSGLDADLLDGKDSSVFAEIGLSPNQVGTNNQSIGRDNALIRRNFFIFSGVGNDIPQIIKLLDISSNQKTLNGVISGARDKTSSYSNTYQIRVNASISGIGVLRAGVTIYAGNSAITSPNLVTFNHEEKTWLGVEFSGTSNNFYPDIWVFDGYYAGGIDLGVVRISDVTNISSFVDTHTQTTHSGKHNFIDYMPQAFGSPIVESGSNANGKYVKYADGTMICYGDRGGTGAFDEVNLFQSFAATFSSIPNLTCCTGCYFYDSLNPVNSSYTTYYGTEFQWNPRGNGITTSGFRYSFKKDASPSSTAYYWLAIGRWY